MFMASFVPRDPLYLDHESCHGNVCSLLLLLLPVIFVILTSLLCYFPTIWRDFSPFLEKLSSYMRCSSSYIERPILLSSSSKERLFSSILSFRENVSKRLTLVASSFIVVRQPSMAEELPALSSLFEDQESTIVFKPIAYGILSKEFPVIIHDVNLLSYYFHVSPSFIFLF